jgi:hypothetical protein
VYLPAPSALTLTLNATTGSSDVVIRDGGSGQTAAAFSPGNYGLNPNTTTYLPSTLMSTDGIGSVKITTAAGNISILLDSSGQAGGMLTLVGGNIDVEANVSVAGGSITLAAPPSLPQNVSPVALGVGTITLGSTASLNVAGLVVNDLPRASAANSLPLVINGGSVNLTGFSLDLKPGSAIDPPAVSQSARQARSAMGKVGASRSQAGVSSAQRMWFR